ncbi:hypothetical protein PAFU01_00370 [Pantoea ananatis]|nr:hypothetical protein PAFU01_00370 [Pantoea ananatis]
MRNAYIKQLGIDLFQATEACEVYFQINEVKLRLPQINLPKKTAFHE